MSENRATADCDADAACCLIGGSCRTLIPVHHRKVTARTYVAPIWETHELISCIHRPGSAHMQNTERAVVRLTETHTEHTDAGPVEWPPLLVWLDAAITAQVKRGQAGSGGTGSPIDTGALDLHNRISAELAALRKALYLPTMRDHSAAVIDTWAAALRYRATNNLTDDTLWERVCDTFPAWVADIEAEWDDRTRRMEVTVPCPRCSVRWIEEREDKDTTRRRAAIVIEYSEGRAPIAECRNETCKALWVGWADVAKLGFTLGASQDAAVLEACGINLNDLMLAPIGEVR